MAEFNSRIAAQRQILDALNIREPRGEELFSLSAKAIERWISANRIDPQSRLVGLVRAASEKLFFLANKSQEQVTEEYRAVSNEIAAILGAIREEIS